MFRQTPNRIMSTIRETIALASNTLGVKSPIGLSARRPVLDLDIHTHVLQTVAKHWMPLPGWSPRSKLIAFQKPASLMKSCLIGSCKISKVAAGKPSVRHASAIEPTPENHSMQMLEVAGVLRWRNANSKPKSHGGNPMRNILLNWQPRNPIISALTSLARRAITEGTACLPTMRRAFLGLSIAPSVGSLCRLVPSSTLARITGLVSALR